MARTILVLALNPSIDAEWSVPRVRWEEKNLVGSERRWPGGKGINVARWLRHFAIPSRLLVPLGGAAGRELARGLRAEKLPATVVPLAEATRVNVIVTTPHQGQLRFNPPGPTLGRREWEALLTQTRRHLRGAALLVLSGSLPRGVPCDAYGTLIQIATDAGVRTLLDCDGDAFHRAIGAGPFLVKPNEAELREWRGSAWKGRQALREAAQALSRITGHWVLVSRGPRPALLVHVREGVAITAAPPLVTAINTVGAGDALVAAVAWQMALGAPPEAWLRHGLATGAAATTRPAGQLPAVGQLESPAQKPPA